MNAQPDIIIVGGGSAGAVLANRLSANPSCKVLLLEAGGVFRPNVYPRVFADADLAGGDADHDWGYRGATGQAGRIIPALRAKVLGGCSTVNAAVALRARREDFAKWAAAGLDGWAYDDVLESFKAVENTSDGDDRYRGRSGPLPIRQRRPEEMTPALAAFIAGAHDLGYPLVDDFNGADQNGVGPYPLNVVSGRRINTGMAFLDDGVRTRPNLTITAHAEIDRVLLDGTRAVGVLDADGREYRAEQIILSAGAFGSPAILMRSGIGPAAHLEQLHIPPVADLPVGDGLQDHPFYSNIYALKPNATNMHPAAGAVLWTASADAEPGDLDIHVSATHLYGPTQSPTGGAIVLAVAVTQPESRGTVRLASRDPRTAPQINYNLLSTPRDMRRMMEAVQISRRIGNDPVFADIIAEEMLPGPTVTTDEQLQDAVLAHLDLYNHPTSTVAMGPPDTAVVDSLGRVHGIDGLSVVDASIMPMVPSATTNVTTMTIAHKIATEAFGYRDTDQSMHPTSGYGAL